MKWPKARALRTVQGAMPSAMTARSSAASSAPRFHEAPLQARNKAKTGRNPNGSERTQRAAESATPAATSQAPRRAPSCEASTTPSSPAVKSAVKSVSVKRMAVKKTTLGHSAQNEPAITPTRRLKSRPPSAQTKPAVAAPSNALASCATSTRAPKTLNSSAIQAAQPGIHRAAGLPSAFV